MPSGEKDLTFAVIILTIIMLIIATMVILLFYNYFKVKSQKDREILKVVFETQEAERNRISEELHDDIGGKLSALKVQNELFLSEHMEEDDRVFGQKNGRLIDTIVTDIRRIVRNQSSRFIIENGIGQELLNLANLYMSLKKNVSIEVDLSDEPVALLPDFEVSLFRILQELLHNSIKHSGASKIRILISPDREKLRVVFTDNGKGFDAEAKADGMGLRNIKARAGLYRGQLSFSSIPNSSTTFEFSFSNQDICKPAAWQES